MLVAGRVGGLTNYELFAQYQELAMMMFGGYMNYTWNPMTKKLTIVRKIPDTGHTYKRPVSVTADGTAAGSTITVTFNEPWPQIVVGGVLTISNSPVTGYNNAYTVLTVDGTGQVFTVEALSTLGSTNITGSDLYRTQVYSPATDDPAETVLLWVYNRKPDSMLLNDHLTFPWIQDYALAVAKDMLGQAREKFAQIAGPQGGTQLNGAALKGEAKAEMEALEEELKRYYDGSQPLTWVIG
jgi:hypothetical protein